MWAERVCQPVCIFTHYRVTQNYFCHSKTNLIKKSWITLLEISLETCAFKCFYAFLTRALQFFCFFSETEPAIYPCTKERLIACVFSSTGSCHVYGRDGSAAHSAFKQGSRGQTPFQYTFPVFVTINLFLIVLMGWIGWRHFGGPLKCCYFTVIRKFNLV